MNWKPKNIIEEHYQKALQSLLNGFNRLLPSLNILTPHDLLIALVKYCESEAVKTYATAATSRMVTSLLIESAKSWRAAALKSSQGRMIYQSLLKEFQGPVGVRANALIKENAELITTFSSRISKEVSNFANQEYLKGKRSEAVAQSLIKQFPNVSRTRIALIARTETSKASTALTQARAENLGLKWYIWRTSKDARVRSSHRLMDKVIVAWDDPPSPEKLARIKSTLGYYNGGDCPNCRCFCEPLIVLDKVAWPAKVYYSGKIQFMTRVKFELIGRMRIAA